MLSGYGSGELYFIIVISTLILAGSFDKHQLSKKIEKITSATDKQILTIIKIFKVFFFIIF